MESNHPPKYLSHDLREGYGLVRAEHEAPVGASKLYRPLGMVKRPPWQRLKARALGRLRARPTALGGLALLAGEAQPTGRARPWLRVHE